MRDAQQQYTVTATPMHLTVDPYWDNIEVLAFGSVCDGIGSERYHGIYDDQVAYVLDPTRTEVIGLVVKDYSELDLGGLDDGEELWDGPRFRVPVLGITDATAGEVLLGIYGRFGPGEPTTDALYFHGAMGTEDAAEALPQWQLALEAGDMKAHYGLGYTLHALGRYEAAFTHLRHYTELVPSNAWAWCWFGKACAAAGQPGEARSAYLRAMEIDPDETDARGLLMDLDHGVGGPGTA